MGSTRRDCTVICIDPCDQSGEDQSKANYRLGSFRQLSQYRQLRLNLLVYGVSHRIIRATSRTAAESFQTGCQLLFVDGDHSYEGCRFDTDRFSRHLADGGILILHDATEIGWPGPRQLATELKHDPAWRWVESSGNCVVFRKAPAVTPDS
jgi:hypothetical protein